MEKISKTDLLKRLHRIKSNDFALRSRSIYDIVEDIQKALAPYEVIVSYEISAAPFGGRKIAYLSIETKKQMCRFEIEQFGRNDVYVTYFSDYKFFN
jgi:hypothetical protein